MSAVYIEAESLAVTYGSALHLNGRYMRIELEMSDRQRRDAIVALLGQMQSDGDALDLLRSEFPHLFEEV